MGFWLYKRQHQGNTRSGPGGPAGGGAQHFRPMSGARTGFVPVHQTFESFERGMPIENHPEHLGYSAEIRGGEGSFTDPSPISPNGPTDHTPIATSYQYAGQHAASYAGVWAAEGAIAAAGASAAAAAESNVPPNAEPDEVPLTREMEDFTRGFHTALGRIGEEDEFNGPGGEPIAVNEGNGVSSGRLNGPSNASEMTSGAPSDIVSDDEEDGTAGGHRPLWQQNRRPSRGVAWM